METLEAIAPTFTAVSAARNGSFCFEDFSAGASVSVFAFLDLDADKEPYGIVGDYEQKYLYYVERGTNGVFRVAAANLASSPKWDNFIIACILASSVCLALDSPRNDPSSTRAVA